MFKTLFTQEPLTFDDLCETKSVTQGLMYLEFEGQDLVHVGRTGSFVPVRENGAELWRIKEDKKYHVTGTKGYLWVERAMALERGITMSNWEDYVDERYFDTLNEDALNTIAKFGSYDKFIT